MDTQLENVMRPVLIDVTVFILLGVFDVVLARFIPPFVRGFYCNDESIHYPKYESTVPSKVLDAVGILLPLTLIVIMELKDSRKKRNSGPVCRIQNYKITSFHWNVYRMVMCYGSGALFNWGLTDTGKKVIGRLRPHFLDVCKPRLNLVECSNSTNMTTFLSYIETGGDFCSVDPSVVNESRVSFPSGHSSFSFYVAVFLVLYMQKKFRSRTLLVKPLIQFAFIATAWFVALSRVMDNKHHWSDVLAGIILGSLVAIINFRVHQNGCLRVPRNAREHTIICSPLEMEMYQNKYSSVN